MIAVIVPFTRPAFIDDVVANFCHQLYKDRILVVVENGAGVGAWGGPCHKPHVLLSRPDVHNKSDALNVGMGAAREAGADYFAVFDDDDWYSPGYLDEVARCAQYDVTGIERYVYQDPSGAQWVNPEGREDCVVKGGLHGGTLAGRIDVAPAFFPVNYCEEILWCRDAVRAGLSMYARRAHDFVYRRFGDVGHRHTFPAHLNTSEMQRI